MIPGGDKPKAKGALVAMLSGVPSAPDSDSAMTESAETDHGFRAVAKAFGIPPEREAAAQAALSQYIRTCAGSDSDDAEEL